MSEENFSIKSKWNKFYVLSYHCNYSLLCGVFPDKLKNAIVTPLFEKGNKEGIENYRLSSLLSVL